MMMLFLSNNLEVSKVIYYRPVLIVFSHQGGEEQDSIHIMNGSLVFYKIITSSNLFTTHFEFEALVESSKKILQYI